MRAVLEDPGSARESVNRDHAIPGLWCLVTGSREWPTAETITTALTECANVAFGSGGELTVMHGGAPGADTIAHRWTARAHRQGWPVANPQVRAAKWKAPCRATCKAGHRRSNDDGTTACPAAGFYRNEAMVAEMVKMKERGARVIVLAFISDGSAGASHCERTARAAGLDPVVFRA